MNKLPKILGLGALVVALSCNNDNVASKVQANNVFSLEPKQVLTVSVREYVESQNKKLSDYNMEGVKCYFPFPNNDTKTMSPYKCAFGIDKINYVEVVVDAKSLAYAYTVDSAIIGTALIPKQKSKE